MLNLKESQGTKKLKKIDQSTLMQAFCIIILLANHYQHGMNSFSEASIFQVDQLRLQEDNSITDDYLNLGDTYNQAYSDFEFEHHKVIPIDLPIFMDEEQFGDEIQKPQVKQLTIQQQFDILFQFKRSVEHKILSGTCFLQTVLHYADEYRMNKFKSIPKQMSEKKTQPVTKQTNRKQKFMISKLESWDVHLKSIRTHFMQKIFHKLWKVPTQQIFRNYCFSGQGSQQQKIHIINYLQEELITIQNNYQDFQLKQEIYEQIIQRIIFCLDLALQLDNQSDELLADILFKGFIAELFHN